MQQFASLQDPIGKANASASFGSAFSRAAPGLPAYFQKGGANVPVNQAAQVLSYRYELSPSLFSHLCGRNFNKSIFIYSV